MEAQGRMDGTGQQKQQRLQSYRLGWLIDCSTVLVESWVLPLLVTQCDCETDNTWVAWI